MSDHPKLPPLWVSLFLYCFAVFGTVMSFIGLVQILGHRLFRFSAFGFSFEESEAVSGLALFTLAGVAFATATGFLIITKTLKAYRFGIFFCLYTLIVIGFGCWFGKSIEDSGIQAALLLVFLVHLCRNRQSWEAFLGKEV